MDDPPRPQAGPNERAELRAGLLARREAWLMEPEFARSQMALAEHLADLLAELTPACLGAYWPMRGEFNPWVPRPPWLTEGRIQIALPRAHRSTRQMDYHLWAGEELVALDDYGIPTATGERVQPAAVLAPCLGYTRTGWRLGYGGGFFDRYLERYPATLTIGVAWSCGEMPVESFQPGRHDRPLMLVVTEHGVLEF